jgi:hypothetical protein
LGVILLKAHCVDILASFADDRLRHGRCYSVQEQERKPMNNSNPLRSRITWAALTAIGLTAGVLAAVLLGAPIGSVVGMMLVTPVMTILVGAVLGTTQWFQLRSVLTRSYRWIPITAVGLGAGLALGVVMVEQIGGLLAGHAVNVFRLSSLDRAVSLLVVGAVAGLSLGATQALALRFPRTLRPSWILRSSLALAIGFPLSSLLVDELIGGLRSPIGVILFFVCAGTVLGASTGRPSLRTV